MSAVSSTAESSFGVKKRRAVVCKSCGATGQRKFPAEVAIHVRNINQPLVFVFPEIAICLNCGKPEFAWEFRIPEDELRMLAKRDAAGTG